MIEKLNGNDSIVIMMNKINEIVDFLNATYFMDKEENKTIMSSTNLTIDTSLSNVKCPCCKESHYMELYNITTAVCCPPIYKDGLNINEDKNFSTTKYQCLSCGKEFFI